MSSRCPSPPLARAGWAALVLVFSALAPAAAGQREIRVCADPNNMPFSSSREDGFENRIMRIVAEELHARLSYEWRAQRRRFLRDTLKAFRCDVVAGVPANLEGIATTAPYYRSSYVFVTRAGEQPLSSFDDPRLASLTIGVQLIGDDGANAPPAHALARRGLAARLRGFTVYGDHGGAAPLSPIVEAVAAAKIDTAAVWGPVAGYFAKRATPPLTVTPVRPAFDGPQLPMVFDISMGVRNSDLALRDEIDAALAKRRRDIEAILDAYGVPRLPH